MARWFTVIWRTDVSSLRILLRKLGDYTADRSPRHLPEQALSLRREGNGRRGGNKDSPKFVASWANEVLTYSFVHGRVLKNSRARSEPCVSLE